MPNKGDVLIIGAGPTGLVLALWLTRSGVRVRIVDKAPEPGKTSRAVGVQARTLELYQQMGLAASVVEGGRPFEAANFWIAGKHEARVEFTYLAKGLTPFPFMMLIFPQDEHEKLLVARLAEIGVHVERPVELLELSQTSDGVTGRLRRPDGTIEDIEASYVAGCDGASSRVREAMNVGFPGGTYSHLFYVADVQGAGPTMNGELHGGLDDSDFLASFPMREPSHARLIGTVRPDAEKQGGGLDFSVVNRRVIERFRLDVERVKWFSTYHVHHRVASSLRVGRMFVLGDAAHVHSPVGGQGMNTGIGDAVNLAWKLAATLHGKASPPLLDSYEEERLPFAQRLVHTTDRAFEFLAADGRIANLARMELAPHLLPTFFHAPAVQRLLFRTISQIELNYRHAALSEGRAGSVRGGDRLPWVQREGASNFAPLRSMAWQAHVYGEAASSLRATCSARQLAIHEFPWQPRAETAGLARDALYLVRPDGYVALAAGPSHASERLEQYLDARGIRTEELRT